VVLEVSREQRNERSSLKVVLEPARKFVLVPFAVGVQQGPGRLMGHLSSEDVAHLGREQGHAVIGGRGRVARNLGNQVQVRAEPKRGAESNGILRFL
jgi:hypothetical protein